MEERFAVTLTQEDRFRFRADFGDGSGAVLQLDEPEPLGTGSGPNASRVLAAAIGNCLSASLLYCLEKARIEVEGIRTRVEGSMARNEDGRIRLARLRVTIEPTFPSMAPGRVQRCLEIFEDFCIVTQSVRAGLQVDVDVELPEPATGTLTEAVA
jgi:uncharacterized OsmC-like protein